MTHLTPGRYASYWLIAILATAAAFVACIFVGPSVEQGRLLSLGIPSDWGSLEDRLLRVTTAAIVGWALAGSGVALQALLRNALADPYVLGISSGASVGVMLWLLGSMPLFMLPAVSESETLQNWILSGSTLPAVVGAVLTALAVFALARARGGGEVDPLTLLLVGVVVSAVNGAIIMILNTMAPGGIKVNLLYYMMGNIGQSTWHGIWVAGAAVAVGWLPLVWVSPAMNVSTLSETEVASLGVRISRLRTLAFFCSAVMTAASIALAGPIGFVGLICPHICRSLFGPDHRQLTVTAPFCGAIFLMLADTFVRSSGKLFNGDLPVGVITALAGGPFFLLILKRRASGRGGYA